MPQTPSPRAATLPDFTPVPRRKARSNGWSAQVQRAFIEALAETGSVRAACRRVGRADHGAYLLRRHPEAESFRAAWAAALDIGIQRIEDVAMDRAINGVEEPVYSYGKLVGTRVKHNDRLLMFMLRGRAPDRFAGGGAARSLNALDSQQLDKLRKQWRAEWDAEQAAKQAAEARVSAAEVRASIERKVAALKRRVVARTSPRAYELDLARTAQTRADDEAGWRPGEPYAPYAEKAAELFPQCLEQVRAEWPRYEEAHPLPTPEELAEWEEVTEPEEQPQAPPEPDTGPRIRRLKDNSWD